MRQTQTATGNRYLLFSLLLAAYFAALFLMYYFKVETILIGVFRELLTLPLLLAQFILLFFIYWHLFMHKQKNTRLIIAALIATATTLLIVKDFF